MRPRRALMYVPGDDEKKIAKAAGLNVDGIILDLEDGVAFNRKEEARALVPEALRTIDFGRSERLVRVNPIPSGRTEVDIEAVLPGRPSTIVLPKVDSADFILKLEELLTAGEKKLGYPPGKISILAMIESAVAFLNLSSICAASPRLQGLIFGSEDFAADTGVIRTSAATELLFARSSLVMHAAAFGLQAIDMVHTNFRDLETLANECKFGAELGFSGKQVIHPAQVEIVQKAFAPSVIAIEKAQRIIASAETLQAEGLGTYGLNGEMVDPAVVKKAERVLASARAAGLIP